MQNWEKKYEWLAHFWVEKFIVDVMKVVNVRSY